MALSVSKSKKPLFSAQPRMNDASTDKRTKDVTTFAALWDPQENKTNIFTIMPGQEEGVNWNEFRGKVQKGVVRVCSVEEWPITDTYLEKVIAPRVSAIRGKNPPEIGVNPKEIKTMDYVGEGIHKTLNHASLATTVGAIAYGTRAIITGEWGMKTLESIQHQIGEGICDVGVGALGGLALVRTLDVLEKWRSSPTRTEATFKGSNDGLYAITDAGLDQLEGRRTEKQLEKLRKDPSVSMPGRAFMPGMA